MHDGHIDLRSHMSRATHRNSRLALLGVLASALVLTGCTGRLAAYVETGFEEPYVGTARFAHLAAPQATTTEQVNAPLGREAADRIAAELGLDASRALTPQQYQLFMSGGGVGGEAAPVALVKESAAILTNSRSNPMRVDVDGQQFDIVLGSYGLYVDPQGNLMSAANADSPTRQVNDVLKPDGYLTTWCQANGLMSVLEGLYASAFTREAVYGVISQREAGTAQIVLHEDGWETSYVGIPMVPAIWITNFALIYMLSPDLAAQMPAYWEPLPHALAQALRSSPNGQVPYSEWRALLEG
jgi:hypothetical protein